MDMYHVIFMLLGLNVILFMWFGETGKFSDDYKSKNPLLIKTHLVGYFGFFIMPAVLGCLGKIDNIYIIIACLTLAGLLILKMFLIFGKYNQTNYYNSNSGNK